MTQLTADEVRHIAKLARLQISDAEVESYSTELAAILSYIDTLTEVDTSTVTPLISVNNTVNQFRADEVRSAAEDVDPDTLLGTSTLPIIDHQIQTPSAHG